MNELPVKLNIGCGMKKALDELGVDIRPFPGVDFVLNIGKDKLPLDDDSVDEIMSDNVFEHLYPEELFFCMEECFRVIKPTGTLHIRVPKAMTRAYYIHPDHKIGFLEDTFGFFQVPGNETHTDPHGYLKGFWHVTIIPQDNPEAVWADLSPNKPGGKYPYTKINV